MKIVKLLISLIFCVILMSCEPIENGNVTITDKQYKEAFTSHTYTMAGKTLIPIPIYHDAEYKLVFEKDGDVHSKYVDKELYDSVSIGDVLYYKDGNLIREVKDHE